MKVLVHLPRDGFSVEMPPATKISELKTWATCFALLGARRPSEAGIPDLKRGGVENGPRHQP